MLREFIGIVCVLVNIIGAIAFLVSFRLTESDDWAWAALIAAVVCGLNIWAWLRFLKEEFDKL